MKKNKSNQLLCMAFNLLFVFAFPALGEDFVSSCGIEILNQSNNTEVNGNRLDLLGSLNQPNKTIEVLVLVKVATEQIWWGGEFYAELLPDGYWYADVRISGPIGQQYDIVAMGIDHRLAQPLLEEMETYPYWERKGAGEELWSRFVAAACDTASISSLRLVLRPMVENE